jgi:hypothetical protein
VSWTFDCTAYNRQRQAQVSAVALLLLRHRCCYARFDLLHCTAVNLKAEAQLDITTHNRADMLYA